MTITVFMLSAATAILLALSIYLYISHRRAADRTATREKNRYEKLLKDQEDEIKRISYLYAELEQSGRGVVAADGDTSSELTSGVPLHTAESLLMEQKRLEADKEDLALRNRKLWDMSVQIQKDKQRIQLLKNELEMRHRGITDSIAYARRIQDAVLPKVQILKDSFADHFLMWLPKETVSGDFYWMKRQGDMVVFAVADCTGHGVPGAFMSMMGVTFLNDICSHIDESTQPSQILENLRNLVIDTLQQDNSNPLEPKDGMDLALCVLNVRTLQLRFAGANNPLYIVRAGQLMEYKAVRNPIGLYPRLRPFETIELQAEQGDYLYMFSDGFADQFNGATGKKLTYMRMKQLLVDINSRTSAGEEQKAMICQYLTDWRGSFIQMDDVLIGGFRI